MVTIVSGGIVAYNINREAFPAIDFDIVTVRTIYPGASPKEVEQYVTQVLEDEIESVDHIEEMYSNSIENISLIVIKLDPELGERKKNYTINRIQRAVDRVRNLPAEIANPPEVTQLDSGELPVLELAISGDMPYEQLHDLSEEIIESIKRLPDAKEPIKYGYLEKEYWVEVSPEKLRTHYIGMPQVITALSHKNLNIPGGVLRSPEGDYLVRTIGEVKTVQEVDDIVIRTNSSGVHLHIRDIGQTRAAFEESNLYFRTNGQASINLIIRKKAKGDIIRLVDDVKKVMEEYKESSSYKDFSVAYVNDMSVFVKKRLGVLIDNGILGMLLVLLCLLLFLSRGIALVAAMGMPVALLGAIVFMKFFGLTINLLTLFSLVIVLGMLVDDAIIVAENIWRHYEEGKSPWDAAIDGTREVIWPVSATILTTVAAFSPLLMVYGIFGKFVESLPKVVIISLVISLIEAMFILPCHAYDMLKLHKWRRENKPLEKQKPLAKTSGLFHYCTRLYVKFLAFALKHRYGFVFALIMLLFASAWVHKNYMKSILFPNEGIEHFFIRADLPPGTSVQITQDKIRVFEQLVKQKVLKDELKDFVTYVGLQQSDNMDPFKAKASHVAQVAVYLSPESDRQRTADMIIASMRQEALDLGSAHGFKKVFFQRQNIGPPVGKPVALRIYGHDFVSIRAASKRLQAALGDIPGVHDISEDYIPGKDELQVRIDEQKANRSFVSTQDVALHLRASLEGQIATYIHEEGKRVPVRVRFDEKDRTDIKSLAASHILNQTGRLVPMQAMAEFSTAPGVSSIRHRNGSRLITVTADLNEKITTSNEVNEKILPVMNQLKTEFPALQMERGGEYEDTSKSMESLAYAFSFALVMIFVILATQFKSMTQPLVVMAAIPFGIVGVLAAFYVHDLPLSFIAMIGMIGLSGVVVNDSIVLVDFINKNREAGVELIKAIINAGRLRFRAVCLTSITTIFGLLPLAYGIGGQDAFLKPAAMALGYGLLFSTILILVFVPALYLIRMDIINLLIAVARPFSRFLGLDLKKIK